MTVSTELAVTPTDADRDASPDVERARTSWSSYGPAAVIAVLPVVVLVVLRTSPYFRLNNGDPFIYVGYSNDFYAHIRRFGYTYHGVRFGLIFPLRASLWLGPVWGYFVLRYLLYQLAIVPLYRVLRPFGVRVALLGAVLFVATPVTAQSILTTYHDTIIVPALTALVCLLILAHRTTAWSSAALVAGAGVLAGVCVNANIFAVALVAIAFAVFAGTLAIERRWMDLLKATGLYAAGAAAVCVAGIIVYDRMFGDSGIYQATLEAVDDINDSNVWRSPSYVWLTTRRFVYPPLIALAVGAVVVWRVRPHSDVLRRTFWLAFWTTAATAGFFAAHQFLLGGSGMEQAYYYSVLIGPTCLLVAATAAMVPWRQHPASWLVVAAPVLLAYVSQLIEIRPFVVYVAVAVALVVVAALRTRSVAVVVVATFAAMSLAWGAGPREIAPIPAAGFQYEPHYEIVFGDADDTAFEAYMLATQLTRVVPTTDDVQPPLIFWYATGDAMLDSVQASFLWQTLTVQQGPPGMPVIAPDDPARLTNAVGGFVVMLGRTTGEIDAGVASLRAAGYVVDVPPAPLRLRYDDSEVVVLISRLLSEPSV